MTCMNTLPEESLSLCARENGVIVAGLTESEFPWDSWTGFTHKFSTGSALCLPGWSSPAVAGAAALRRDQGLAACDWNNGWQLRAVLPGNAALDVEMFADIRLLLLATWRSFSAVGLWLKFTASLASRRSFNTSSPSLEDSSPDSWTVESGDSDTSGDFISQGLITSAARSEWCWASRRWCSNDAGLGAWNQEVIIRLRWLVLATLTTSVSWLICATPVFTSLLPADDVYFVGRPICIAAQNNTVREFVFLRFLNKKTRLLRFLKQHFKKT